MKTYEHAEYNEQICIIHNFLMISFMFWYIIAGIIVVRKLSFTAIYFLWGIINNST